MEHFKKLNSINVNEHTEKNGNGLTYLSWCWAWAEVKKEYPDANYKISTFDGKPYLFDEKLGYMVFTEMTIEGKTHGMWLPVMNGANKAQTDHAYTYKVKVFEWNPNTRKKEWNGEYEEKTVEAATMFDINTALMRCLTKNIAMFGLGLYIYAGEDLPEGAEEDTADIPTKKQEPAPRAESAPKKQDIDYGKVTMPFGKHKGKTLSEIYDEAPDYIEWLAENSNNDDIRDAARKVLECATANTKSARGQETLTLEDNGDLPF